MKKLIVTAMLLALAGPGLAQTPAEQALGAKVMQEIQSGLNCNTALITTKDDLTKARAELEKAEARIKELEPKLEGK